MNVLKETGTPGSVPKAKTSPGRYHALTRLQLAVGWYAWKSLRIPLVLVLHAVNVIVDPWLVIAFTVEQALGRIETKRELDRWNNERDETP
ncbi:MAG TPA: hypothetical protein VHR36_15885 [Pyrinomonadaceae bacterium]|jgi:hypothetical protein|nr:hypothetical protein [Pyrinomonadaceae bacterium]